MTERAWHVLSAEDTATELHVDIGVGLGDAEAATRLVAHGPNALVAAKPPSAFALLVHQFRSLLVGLLVAAGGVAFVLGEVVEAIAILVVIVLNAGIGFLTERKAASALAGLRHRAVAVARVLREGAERQIAAEELVPGDVVRLSTGDRVPADGHVIDQVRLQADEAALTGESLPVAKSADPVAEPEAVLGDQTSMVHMGTAITDGRATFIVTATGAQTEMGKIGTLIDGVGTQQTPLEEKLAQLSRALLVIVLVLCAVIVGVGWLRGNSLLFMVEVGISLAIAAVPEGLLAVTTMTLAVGMQRMARMNALVRRLPAVEALGSTTVICTDKTGTLTRNEMTVRALAVAGRRVAVTGTGYALEGELEIDGTKFTPAKAGVTEGPLELALRIGALCNDAKLDRSESETTVLGDPTEGALIVAAEKAGLDPAELARAYPRTGEVPFDRKTKMMVTVHDTPDGSSVAYVKGSPAAVLDACVSMLTVDGVVAMSSEARQHERETNDELAAKALRVLGLAYRAIPEQLDDEALTTELTFVGLVGMIDPLRDEAKATVAICREAGIRAVMITGDQTATAAEIARQLGLDIDRARQPAEDRARSRAERPRSGRLAEGCRQRGRLRPRDAGAQAQDRRRSPASGTGGRDDRRWRERCPRAPASGHRHRHGDPGNRGREGVGRHGDDRRQLLEHRACRGAGTDHRQQHPALHPLPVLMQLRRDRHRVRGDHDRLAAAARCAADSLAQLDHGHLPRDGARPRAVGTRRDEAARRAIPRSL